MTTHFLKVSLLVLSVVFSACSEEAKVSSAHTLGDTKSRDGIVGGVDLDADHFLTKHTVALYDVAQGSLCTGAIISERHILTAAHCISRSPELLLVIFGVDLTTEDLEVRPVSVGKLHEIWGSLDLATQLDVGDIAVLQFEGGLPNGYEPVEILPGDQVLVDGQEVVLAGFGVSDPEKGEGSGRLRGVVAVVERAQLGARRTEVLLNQSNGRGACVGDSGGPGFVVDWESEKIFLWGVTSRGEDGCKTGAIYTNASAYRSWVDSAITELSDRLTH